MKSCDLNDGLSCHNLGVLYQNGYGDVKRPHTKAKEYFSKASNLGLDPDCKNIRF
nr:sel1 repeat family protein [Campylobacter pinnipediorum]